MSTQPKITVAVLGSTGVVGRALVDAASHDQRISQVIAITRRPYFNETSNPPINQSIKQVIVEDLHSIKPETFANVDAVYCALGTTRADAGSADAFLHQDRDLIIKCATVAQQAEIKSFSLTSTLGANANSYMLYPKSKGETEEAIKRLNFPHLAIFRPAGLNYTKYPRHNSRMMEKFFLGIMHYTPGINRSKWANTKVEDIASAIINDTFANKDKSFVLYEGTNEIVKMAQPSSNQASN